MIHKDVASTFLMDKKQMLFYFTKADEVLREMDKHLDLYVCGGANMSFYAGSRDSTHDIDTAPSDENILRELSNKMQSLFPLPNTWLNPSGQIFITQKMKDESILGLEFNNLKVFFLSFTSMLVLKVLSGRMGEEFHDLNDTIFLLQKLKITSLPEVDRLVMSYKPDTTNASEHLKRYLILSNQSEAHNSLSPANC
jgi:hypothetical protein